MKKYTITIEFLKDVLGTGVANEDLAKNYIVKKLMQGRTGLSAEIASAKIDEELENMKKDKELQDKIAEIEERAFTVFYRNEEGKPSMADHQIKGWFKAAYAFLAKEKEITNKAITKKGAKAEEHLS